MSLSSAFSLTFSPPPYWALGLPWWLKTVKNLPAMWETRVQSLGLEDPLKKGMAAHSSIPVWKVPWTEETDGLQSVGSQSVGHDWLTNTFTFILNIGKDKSVASFFQRHWFQTICYLLAHHLQVCMFSCFSCVWLFATPWTVAHQAPLSMGFSRQEYWSELLCPPPGDLPDPGIELPSPGVAAEFLTHWASWEACSSSDLTAFLKVLPTLLSRKPDTQELRDIRCPDCLKTG